MKQKRGKSNEKMCKTSFFYNFAFEIINNMSVELYHSHLHLASE